MKKRLLLSVVLCSSTLFADPSSDDALRKEFEAYKADSEARIQALEKKVEENTEETANQQELLDRSPLDFEFHGYFRAGMGINGNGESMEAFQAPYAGSKYRLGNEAEAYIELTYIQNFLPESLQKNGVDFSIVFTLAYVTPTSSNNDFDTSTTVREAYAKAKGVWAAQKEAVFWAGNRYYQQVDVHMNDFFFRDMAGFGGGIEDVHLGDNLNMALAWLGGSIDSLNSDGSVVGEDEFRLNKNTLDLCFYGMDTGIGKLSIALDIVNFKGDTIDLDTVNDVRLQNSTGYSITSILESDLSKNLKNRFVLQYGTAAADNFKAVMDAPIGVNWASGMVFDMDDTWRFRVMDDILIENGSPISLQGLVLYERYDNGLNEGGLDWISTGLRPIYHFGDYFSLALEAGADYTSKEGEESGVLGKLTFAPQITPQSTHFSRPAIRAYLTYARWSDGFEGQVAPIAYSDEQDGISAGVQVEAWW
jgi:maltoporin